MQAVRDHLCGILPFHAIVFDDFQGLATCPMEKTPTAPILIPQSCNRAYPPLQSCAPNNNTNTTMQ